MNQTLIRTTSTLFALLLTTELISRGYSQSNSQEASPIVQTNIRGQLQPTSARASVDKGWVANASFLYWNAKADGFQFAEKATLEGLDPNGAPTMLNVKGTLETPSFNTWDPGVQLGIGYIFPEREQWHAHLSWTHLNTSSRSSIKILDEDVSTKRLIPTLFPFLVGSLADRAAADWKLHFNILDLELDRQFFVGKWLFFKPKIGLRGAWIKQDFQAKYHAFFLTNTGSFDFNHIFFCKQSFGGVGLKFGTDAQFYLSPSWSILGNFFSSFLWGSTKLEEKATGRIFVSDTLSFPEAVKFSRKIDRIRTALDGQLGMQWQTYCYQGKYRFAISALYSISYWFSQNMLVNQIVNFLPNLQQPGVVDAPTNGDLQLQGLNLQFEFDF